jgi:ABC-type transport system involved in multi-copper enzyme maturation permease subunit
MNLTWQFSVRRCAAVARAEFLKIWSSKIPLVILVALPIGTYLFILELYHVERMAERLGVRNAVQALPLVFFATWKTPLFQAAMLTFAAFWTTVDSQYGMVRVGCCQPLTRAEYLLGKWCGIGTHVVLFSVALVLSELMWTGIYSGFAGVGVADVVRVARFAFDLAVLVAAISVVAMAAASSRRTVGSGIVTALMAFILLALMTMIPFDLVSPRLVLLRYFFYPLQELAVPVSTGADSPFRRPEFLTSFYAVALATPLLFAVPAALYFRSRDIVE